MALGEGSLPLLVEEVIVEAAHGSQFVCLEEVLLHFRRLFVGGGTRCAYGVPDGALVIGGQHLRAVDGVGDTELSVVGNLRGAHLPAFGLHEHDTLCGAGAVDGSRSVLQDGDALHLVGVEVVERLFVGHEVVDDIERRRAGLSTLAGIGGSHLCLADLQGRSLTGTAEATAGAESVDESAQGGAEVAHREVLDFVGLDDLDGTRDVLHLLSTVTHDDHFVEFHHVLAQGHLHAVLRSDGLGDIADVGDDEFGIGRHLQGEVPVDVGDDTCGGAFSLDRCTDDGHARLVDHRTLDGPCVLLLGCRGIASACFQGRDGRAHCREAYTVENISCLHKSSGL